MKRISATGWLCTLPLIALADSLQGLGYAMVIIFLIVGIAIGASIIGIYYYFRGKKVGEVILLAVATLLLLPALLAIREPWHDVSSLLDICLPLVLFSIILSRKWKYNKQNIAYFSLLKVVLTLLAFSFIRMDSALALIGWILFPSFAILDFLLVKRWYWSEERPAVKHSVFRVTNSSTLLALLFLGTGALLWPLESLPDIIEDITDYYDIEIVFVVSTYVIVSNLSTLAATKMYKD